ncbi:MAG: S9 family peptidase [Burkholderiales bacterium]|nr:S9 family peptidase [Burkholderiales bacterium]
MIQRLAVCLAAWLGLFASTARAEPPPAAAFFKKPAITAPRLSPSGRYLAVQVEGKDGRQRLAVIDLQTMGPPQVVAGFNDADVSTPYWLNDQRLVFRLANSQDGSTRVMTPGLWAVDRDGGQQRQLILSSWNAEGSVHTQIKDRRLELNWSLVSVMGGEADEILVVRFPYVEERDTTGVQFARLNTRTGERRNLSFGLPDGVFDWHSSDGELWAVNADLKGRNQIYLREGQGWRLWQEVPTYEGVATPFWSSENGPTLIMDQHDGNTALFKMDRSTLKRDALPLLSAKGFDVNGDAEYDPQARRLVGIHYEFDAQGTAWFDPAMKAHQADIDAKLPGSVNRISCGNCLSSQNLLVTALSDQQPPVYYIYRVAEKQLQVVAGPRPDLKRRDMGLRDYHRAPARDGRMTPVLVTQPAGGVGKQAHPTIVLVRGGLGIRNTHWAWEPTAQFLASRGYLVLEPEFRGSGGYGQEHFRAGWKQWGLAMQDDLADSLAWAVKQGWADPQRACIVGGGYYGGYAALMGAVRQGEQFKCAVSWGGVTDIGAMSSIHWSFFSEEWKRYGMKRLVADPDTDGEQIRATSPLQRAQEIRMPLLVAYGDSDGYVPLKHGSDLRAALREDQPLEWVVYNRESNRWSNLQTNEDFWGRVERFLARNIGAAAPQ